MAIIDMYANVNLISHTKLVCENLAFSEPYYLENKWGVGKPFNYFCKAIDNLVIWKMSKCFPKMLLVWHCSKNLGYEPTE
jgi:hypothetical protein